MDELNDAQLSELQGDLVLLQQELQQAVSASTKAAATVSLDQPIGRISRVDALQQQAMATEQKRRHRVRLLQVQRAMRAFDSDSYGYCVDCEEPIGYRRLKVRPESPFCLTCQSARE